MESQSCFDFIFLMTKDLKHFLWCLLAILNSSVESFLIRSELHFFLIGLFVLFGDQFLELFVYFGDQSLSDVGWVKTFSHSIGCCFVLLTMSFALQKLFSFRRSHLLIVSPVSVLQCVYWSFI